MKKYLKLLFVAIFASMSFAFVSCGDDEDEPENIGSGGSSSTSLSINGTKVPKILASQVEGNTFVSYLWYNDFSFDFEVYYYGKISNLAVGDDISDNIKISRCENVNNVLIDGSYEILGGSVTVSSISSESITLKYSNLKIQQYVGSTEREIYTINGSLSYSF